MTKDAYYFPHFCNARHDRKIKRVTKQLGVEGYGIYFMLLEVLREQSDYKYPISDVDLLADEFGTSEAKVIALIKNYDLFIVDDCNMFFSENLITNMQPYIKMKEQRVLAGKASAEKRKQLQPFNNRLTTVQQSKVKESKVKESKVFIAPTILEVKEYFKLNGYPESLAVRAFNHYDCANWVDTKGNKVLNWKQKIQTVWFKEENKIKDEGKPFFAVLKQ
jgi:hypothetical protein